jgi:O-antigen/teichoic acid export membrane protein
MTAARRSLIGSVAVQALGAGATFAVGIAIALLQGPEAQGRYGLVRSAADLLLALALFGLPQSMVHALNRLGTSAAALERWSLRYALALLLLALIVVLAVALDDASSTLPPWLDGPYALLALLLGAVGWVLQGLQRVFVLCRASALRFGWLSVTPALTLLVAVAVLLALESQRYAFAIAASGVASALLGALQLRGLRATPGWARGGAAPWRTLWTTGTHAFAQSVAIALQPWLSFVLLRQHGASVAEVGQFVFAAYVYQAFVLPAGFVAPLLLARISAAGGAGRDYAVQDRLRRALLVTALVAGLAALSLPPLVPALFGAAYAPAVAACVWLALSGPLIVANRLGVSVLLGRARFRAASAHALLRALLVPLVVSVCLLFEPARAITAAAFAWWLIEALCAAALLLWWRAAAPARVAAIEGER